MSDDRAQMLSVLNEQWASRREGVRVDIPEDVTVRMNVPYGSGGEVELTADLFLPPDRFEGPRPAMLYIHGGGWRAGTPAQFYRQAARLAQQGIVGACCRYRFSGEVTFPGSVHDCKAAVRWLRANADDLTVDPQRIGALGGSAGGHLAGMLATTAGVEELEGNGGNPGVSSAVQLGILLNPITDMTVFVEGTNLHPAALEYMGGTPADMTDRYRLASPLLHVDERTPPCLLVHGSADETVPCEQSEMFAEALLEVGTTAELLLVDDVGHGFFNSDPHYEPVYLQIEEFVLQNLSG